MGEREELVRDLATRYHIKGFEKSPLEREEASQFLATLNDIKRRQHAETDKLQVYSLSRILAQSERHIIYRPRAGTATKSTI